MYASLISGEAAELSFERGSESECWDWKQSEAVWGTEDKDHTTEKHPTAGQNTEEAHRGKTHMTLYNVLVFALCE